MDRSFVGLLMMAIDLVLEGSRVEIVDEIESSDESSLEFKKSQVAPTPHSTDADAEAAAMALQQCRDGGEVSLSGAC